MLSNVATYSPLKNNDMYNASYFKTHRHGSEFAK